MISYKLVQICFFQFAPETARQKMAIAHVELSGFDDLHSDNFSSGQNVLLYTFLHLKYDGNHSDYFTNTEEWKSTVFFIYVVVTCIAAIVLNGYALIAMFITEKDVVEKWSTRNFLLGNSCLINLLTVTLTYIWEAVYMYYKRWTFGHGFFVLCVNAEEILNAAMTIVTVSLCLHQLMRLVVTYENRIFWMVVTVMLTILPWLYALISSGPWLINRSFLVIYYEDGVIDVAQWHGNEAVTRYAYHVFFADLLCPLIVAVILFTTAFSVHLVTKPRPSYSRMNSRETTIFWRAEQPETLMGEVPDWMLINEFQKSEEKVPPKEEQMEQSWDDLSPILDTIKPQRNLQQKVSLVIRKTKHLDWVPGLFLLVNVVMQVPYYAIFLLVALDKDPHAISFEGSYAWHASAVFVQPIVIIVFLIRNRKKLAETNEANV